MPSTTLLEFTASAELVDYICELISIPQNIIFIILRWCEHVL